MICNANPGRASSKCAVKAGSTVTVEMHQQNGDRSCGNQAIGGAHWGPVQVYMAKVGDSSSATPSAGWFKIFSDGWAKKSGGSSGDDDFWGTKDLDACCGRMDVTVPSFVADGDYLLRAEALALHTAGSSGQAQFYMTCYQLTVSGGKGGGSPATVSFPGAYKSSDPGILIDIHAPMSSYVAPGPPVCSGGGTRAAGSACTGCESSCKPGGGGSGGGGKGE